MPAARAHLELPAMTPLLKTSIVLASVDDILEIILEIIRLIPRLQFGRSENLQP